MKDSESDTGERISSRLYRGMRRIDITLPAVLVGQLDQNVAQLGYYVSRSSVIEVAIRLFLDRGGVQSAAPGVVFR